MLQNSSLHSFFDLEKDHVFWLFSPLLVANTRFSCRFLSYYSFLVITQSPIFPWDHRYVDRWFRRAPILVSWCGQNWEKYKVPMGRGWRAVVHWRGARKNCDNWPPRTGHVRKQRLWHNLSAYPFLDVGILPQNKMIASIPGCIKSGYSSHLPWQPFSESPQ